MKKNPLLKVEDIHLTLGQGGRTLLSCAQFEIASGEIVGLVGRNGSGKTTFALALLGLLRKRGGACMEGTVLFKGQDFQRLHEKDLQKVRGQEIGFVFQDPSRALDPLQKVRDHLKEAILGEFGSREERVQELLSAVGLQERHLDQYPFQLSGGEAQRVMIAIAVANNPSLLIADEPTTSLDEGVRRDILSLLKKLQKDLHMSVLLISHDHAVLKGVASRVFALEEGKILPCDNLERMPKKKALAKSHASKGEKPLLEVSHLDVSLPLKGGGWGKGKVFSLIENGELSIHHGQIVGLVGANGAGKTSFAKALLGLIEAQGYITFKGRARGPVLSKIKLCERRHLQMVFQNPLSSLNPQFAIREILEEGLLLHFPDLTEQECVEKVLGALKEVGLGEEYLGRYPEGLSGGEAQKVALARVLILEPDLIVLDEPTASMDKQSVDVLEETIKELNKEKGVAFLLISHDNDFVQLLCHRHYIMADGRIRLLV